MKNKLQKALALSLLTSFSFLSQAQEVDRNVKEKFFDEKGQPTLIIFNEGSKLSSSNFQSILKENLKLKSGFSFQKIKEETDNLGLLHEKFQLFYNNVKVEFATYTINSKGGRVVSMNGEVYNPSTINVNPTISVAKALELAKRTTSSSSFLWDNTKEASLIGYSKPQGELVLLPDLKDVYIEGTQPELLLAYKFDIYATNPVSRADVYIDAKNGKVLFYNATIKHATNFGHGSAHLFGESHTCLENKNAEKITKTFEALVAGTAATRYSGSQSIQTTLSGGSYILKDNTRGSGVNTYDLNTGTSYGSAVNFTDNDNNWTTAEHSANKDNGALDAHWGAEKTYDYWSAVHSRNSFNNSGAAINSYVHYSSNYDNAFWDGSRMTYGDGSGTYFDILTALDVAAHEIGHAVCTYTANLAYQRESGALNEAFSDIWGAAVEYYAAPNKSPWLIGEDIERRSGHAALRSMSDPNSEGQPDTYGGTYWSNPNCGTPTQSNDYCGVHRNSGVLNHWFYILSVGKSGTNDIGNSYNVTGISIDKAAKIAYRLESVYLSSNSTFANARTYGIQAAIDLYGASSAEVIATTNAFYAVGIGSEYSDGGGGTTCSTTITSFPYSEGFENTLGAWSQGSGDDFDWIVDANGTPSSGTGPSSAAEGTYYVYVEASVPNSPTKTTILNSPCYNLNGATEATFTFKYHMYGASSMGTLKLQASTNGSTWTDIWSKSGNQGNSWLSASVSLSSYTGSTVQLRFHGTTGSTYQGDMAVDDVMLSTGTINPPTCTNVNINFVFDNYPEETSWQILNSSNQVVESGGTYGSQADGSSLTITKCLAAGCYTFKINDSYGDGICCSYGNGSYSVTSNGSTLASGGSFGSSESTNFCVGTSGLISNISTITETSEGIDFVMYPNPVKGDILHVISNDGMKDYKVYNIMGQLVLQGQIKNDQINIGSLNGGIYVVELNTYKEKITKKFIKE
ncbi:T9SS type A sorting domain-containing protein [Flavobacterium jejuense]|uniref:T9SS type A sorting domain-containing protein n=1 Tax=Flavobacterium jejuense TaxID=1544455 RepID=A0ABX0IYX1_9FLAO|nr:M4 family metallopeptidase [Flavobacterium jejuense]NHN26949.1 T9SS type A sorting domain-containing protein [Flavobacterium jejuense]